MATNINPTTAPASVNLHDVLTTIGLDFPQWYNLGVFLKIDENKLDAIAENFRAVRMRFTKTVQQWLRSNDSPTWEDIREALKKLGERALAEKISTKYCSASCEPPPQEGSSTEKLLLLPPDGNSEGSDRNDSTSCREVESEVMSLTDEESRDLQHLSRKFAVMLSKLIPKMDKALDVETLKRFLQHFRDVRTGKPYIEPAIYQRCASTAEVLDALLEQNITAKKLSLLNTIVEEYGCVGSKSLLCEYKQKLSISTPPSVSLPSTSDGPPLPVLQHQLSVAGCPNPMASSQPTPVLTPQPPVPPDQQCKLPGCTRSKYVEPSGRVHDFCGRTHAHSRKFMEQGAVSYCLFPGCTEQKQLSLGESLLHQKDTIEFCSSQHYQEAIEMGLSALVEVASTTEEYQSVHDLFKQRWAKAKGSCPPIEAIIRVINPAVSEKFEKYRNNLPSGYQTVERQFHGTKLQCAITSFFEFCNKDTCGICGIGRNGFCRSRVQCRRWQRFGLAFYLAQNSSKAYDYPLEVDADSESPLRAVFLCNVAPGKKYATRYNKAQLSGPPMGYNSVQGMSKFLWFGDLNYEEIAVYNEDAIYPCYVIVYASSK